VADQTLCLSFISDQQDDFAMQMFTLDKGNPTPVKTVAELVSHVLANVAATGCKVKRLHILVQGAAGAFRIGPDDQISLQTVVRFAHWLAKLTPHFDPDAEVVLCSCHSGDGNEESRLLKYLSNLWGGVKVVCHSM
jgi:hypothetical protein